MATDVTRNEFEQLKTRVDVVEREVEGEKMVTRHILEQTRRNGDDLAAVKARLDRHGDDLAAIKSRLDRNDQRFDGLERHVRQELPRIIGDVMRGVLRERDRER
jgi:tetrahydromethanopterin S-methyltransferase subunit G